jgi:hypothetical protein
MMRSAIPSAFGAALLLCAACSAPATPPAAPAAATATADGAALFRTDSLAYTLRAGATGYEATIGVTFTNRSGGTAYFVNCRGATGVSLEKLVDGQWTAVYSPVINQCLSAPITVAAGATHRTQIAVSAGLPGSNVYPQFTVADVSGEYRAVWHHVLRSYQDRLPFGDPLPLESRISNRFSLTVRSR